MVRLPASRHCFEVKIVSWKETEYNEQDCDKIVERGIILTSDAWKLLRRDIEVNCHSVQCKQITGAADKLFLTIDQMLNVYGD